MTPELQAQADWHVVEDDSMQDELGNGPLGVAISPIEDDVTDAIAWVNTDLAEWEQNAALLAAAPKLLRTLEALVRANENWNAAVATVMGGTPPGWSDEYLNAAREAIADAKGQR